MADLMNQLGFVCAVLGGFAFTFVGGLLSSTSASRVYAWVFGTSLFASMALMIAAVGATLAGLAARGDYAADLGGVHQLVSQAFLLGVVALLLAAGLSGWLRSRQLGYVSLALAGIALFVAALMLWPFLAVV